MLRIACVSGRVYAAFSGNRTCSFGKAGCLSKNGGQKTPLPIRNTVQGGSVSRSFQNGSDAKFLCPFLTGVRRAFFLWPSPCPLFLARSGDFWKNRSMRTRISFGKNPMRTENAPRFSLGAGMRISISMFRLSDFLLTILQKACSRLHKINPPHRQ